MANFTLRLSITKAEHEQFKADAQAQGRTLNAHLRAKLGLSFTIGQANVGHRSSMYRAVVEPVDGDLVDDEYITPVPMTRSVADEPASFLRNGKTWVESSAEEKRQASNEFAKLKRMKVQLGELVPESEPYDPLSGFSEEEWAEMQRVEASGVSDLQNPSGSGATGRAGYGEPSDEEFRASVEPVRLAKKAEAEEAGWVWNERRGMAVDGEGRQIEKNREGKWVVVESWI